MLYRKFVLFIIVSCLIITSSHTSTTAEDQNGLPPFIKVTDYGGVPRQQFPVTGGIPLPKGALTAEELSDLAMSSEDSQRIPAGFQHYQNW
jgi:hypothetical protein